MISTSVGSEALIQYFWKVSAIEIWPGSRVDRRAGNCAFEMLTQDACGSQHLRCPQARLPAQQTAGVFTASEVARNFSFARRAFRPLDNRSRKDANTDAVSADDAGNAAYSFHVLKMTTAAA